MKQILKFTLLVFSIVFVAGACQKSKIPLPGGGMPGGTDPGGSGPGGQTSTYFFENTEWTGIMQSYGQQYPQACYIRFNGDSTASVYALFAWVLDGVNLSWYDSTVGNITGIDTVTNGVTTINVNFALTNDQQVYTIANHKTLSGGSLGNSAAFYYNVFHPSLELCSKVIPSVAGTTWNTEIQYQGYHAYPDINDFSFSSDGSQSTIYYRGGHIVTFSPSVLAVEYVYHQVGARIYFAGYNESIDKLIPYFGVLSPDGKTIWADVRDHVNGRVPYQTQSYDYYGFKGTTPTTLRQ